MSLSVNDLIEMISRGAQRCDWSTWRAAWGAHQRVAGEPRLHGWGLPSEKHGGVEMPGGRGAPGKVSQEHECMAVRSVTRRRHPVLDSVGAGQRAQRTGWAVVCAGG